MKCPKCGEELTGLEKVCGKCGADLAEHTAVPEAPAAEAAPEAPSAPREASQAPAPAPAPKKKTAKLVIAAAAAVALIGGGAFGVMKLTEKDPKEVVIDAFKNVYSKEQVYPVEEIFGFSELQKNSIGSSMEEGLELVLSSCSDESVDEYAGSGFRVEGKQDAEAKKSVADIGIIYNDMDLLTMKLYYGDEMLMAAVPELVEKVFVLDLSEGLADRMKASPTLGPVLEEQDIDVDGLFGLMKETLDKAYTEEASDPYDLKGLVNRYKEGCKAQENFKAAMTVEKAGKKSCQMDGAEINCRGYQVHISKDAMIAFLRTSSDFFLQDEQLKQAYLENLELSTRMMSFFGDSAAGMSAKELQEQTYEEVSAQVTEVIDQLDQSLQDVDMMVYVDKKGRLAALEGTTAVIPAAEDDAGNQTDGEPVPVSFAVNLQGGTYLTQNAWASVTTENDGEPVTLELTKTGNYGEGLLDCSYQVSVNEIVLNFDGHYTVEAGEYALNGNVQMDGAEKGSLSISGVVDQLEKGVSFHADMDEFSLKLPEESVELTLSGEYYARPLAEEVTAPEGEQMDVLAATEEDWQAVAMKAVFSFISLMGQFENGQY